MVTPGRGSRTRVVCSPGLGEYRVDVSAVEEIAYVHVAQGINPSFGGLVLPQGFPGV